MDYYGNQDLYQGTYGLNWRAVWNESAFSNTSLSVTSSKYDEDFWETFKTPVSEIADVKNRTNELEYKLRNVNFKRFSEKLSIDFGIDVKHLQHDYDNYLAETTNATGDTIPELIFIEQIYAEKLGGFISLNYDPVPKFSTSIGMRVDYFTMNKNVTISPRFSSKYKLNEKTSFNGSTGIFYQNLPLLLLSQNENNTTLKDPFAIHYILGMEHLLSKYKSYDRVWRDRDYDNRYIVSIEGGYKPTPGLELSLRWIYAGGVPYTPIDEQLSAANHQVVYDETKINSERYPDYHSMNIRLDKRFFFQ